MYLINVIFQLILILPHGFVKITSFSEKIVSCLLCQTRILC